MNRTQILSKLRKMLGPKVGYSHDPNAPDADERAAYRLKYREAVAELAVANESLRARRAKLLADPEYQRMWAECKALTSQRDEAHGKLFRYPITVETPFSIGVRVVAQGDTWPEVFAKLEAKH